MNNAKFAILTKKELKSIKGAGLTDADGKIIPAVRKNKDGVYSIKDGEVIKIGKWDGTKAASYGNYVIVRDRKNGILVRYAHLNTVNVKLGQTLKQNDEIGIMGNTGTIHKHLHVSVYKDNTIYANDQTKEEAIRKNTAFLNGSEENPFDYIRDGGVWPSNTKISGGYGAKSYYYFSSTNRMWYPHEGADFSGNEVNIIKDWQYGLPGNGYYNKDDGTGEKNIKLYFSVKDEQKLAVNGIAKKWKALTGKEAPTRNLNNLQIRSLEAGISNLKEKKKNIFITVNDLEERLKTLTKDTKEYNENLEKIKTSKEQLQVITNNLEVKELRRKLHRIGSIEFAKRLDKKNAAKNNISNLEKKLKQAREDYEKALKNPEYSKNIKGMYKNYAASLKEALHKAKNNLDKAEKNLKLFVDDKKELQLNTITQPTVPDFAGEIEKERRKRAEAAEKARKEAEKNNNYDYDNDDDDDEDDDDTATSPSPPQADDNDTSPEPPSSDNGNRGGGSNDSPDPPPAGNIRGGLHERNHMAEFYSYNQSINTQYPLLGDYYIEYIKSKPVSSSTLPPAYYSEPKDTPPQLQGTINIGLSGTPSSDIVIEKNNLNSEY